MEFSVFFHAADCVRVSAELKTKAPVRGEAPEAVPVPWVNLSHIFPEICYGLAKVRGLVLVFDNSRLASTTTTVIRCRLSFAVIITSISHNGFRP